MAEKPVLFTFSNPVNVFTYYHISSDCISYDAVRVSNPWRLANLQMKKNEIFFALFSVFLVISNRPHVSCLIWHKHLYSSIDYRSPNSFTYFLPAAILSWPWLADTVIYQNNRRLFVSWHVYRCNNINNKTDPYIFIPQSIRNKLLVYIQCLLFIKCSQARFKRFKT